MNRFAVLSLVAGVAACAVGCNSAHYVSKEADGGIVAIPSNSNYWPFRYKHDAEELIRQHVGPDYEIVHEGLVVTGVQTTNTEQTQRDYANNKKQPNLPGVKETTTGTVTTNNTTEWQITYRRLYTLSNGTAKPPTGAGTAPAVQLVGGVGAVPSASDRPPRDY